MIKLKRLGFILVLFAVVAGIIFLFARDDKKSLQNVGIYFYTGDKSTVELVNCEIVNESGNIYLDVAKRICQGPLNQNNLPVVDKNVKALGATLSGNDLSVDFSREIAKEDIVSIYAIIKTYSRFSEVKRVRILADGMEILKDDAAPLGFISGDEINFESDDDFSARITLYFANEDKTALVPESRKIVITDSQPEEEYILSELIKGPKNVKSKKLLSGDNEILSVETTDGTCYVNTKKSFVGKTKQPDDMLTIYSIVNSLTELDYVKNVQFLVGGKKAEETDAISQGELFVRNEAIIEK